MAVGRTTQEHVSVNKFDVTRIAEEDAYVNASAIPTGFPDVYVNGEDVTVTVDPVGNAMWVRDAVVGARHARSVARGALKDHAGVLLVQHLIDDRNLSAPPNNFIPTSVHLNKANKFSAQCVSNSTRGAVAIKGPNVGKLPIINALHWNGQLADKPDWLVEQEVWNSRDLTARFFDCRGRCR